LIKQEKLKGVSSMEYDHLIVPGMNYRRTKEDIMKEVKLDGKEWHDKELGLRLKKGGDKAKVVSKLDADTKTHELELRRGRHNATRVITT
jgi:hypothetical protein